VLGTGVALCFSQSTVAKVFLEELRRFEHDQVTRASFLVRIVIHPSDKASSKVKDNAVAVPCDRNGSCFVRGTGIKPFTSSRQAFQSAQETLHLRGFTNDATPDQG